MKAFLASLYFVFLRLGGFGLLIMGVLDSSFLFMPLGNDLLIVAMTVKKHAMLPYYAFMAASGSVLGCALVDFLSRKGGEAGLEKTMSPRRLEYVKKKVKKSAGWAVAFASLMPPPFPFTPFIAAASALQYSRKKLLTVVAVTRLVRFLIVGLLAVVFGERILHLAEKPALQYAILAIVVISIAGSALSIYTWIKRSRKVQAVK